MWETAGVALATFFATVGPIDVAAVFAALTASSTLSDRRSIALRGVLLATIILLIVAVFGEFVLTSLGISLAALQTAGGILLMLIGIEMAFARPSGATSATVAEVHEAERKPDIAVFPLATPLIAGPGSMGAIILLMAETGGEVVLQFVVCASLLLILLLTLIFMLIANQLQERLGVTGMHVISRIFGVVLTALAVQFIFNGIASSGLLSAR